MDSGLGNIQALIFDIFGTCVDWYSSVTEALAALGKKYSVDGDWSAFAKTWRRGYMDGIKEVVKSGKGSLNMDVMHREILETMLQSPEWSHFGALLDKDERYKLNTAWHHLHGWADTTPGLYSLKKQTMICALSNGNVRFLVDVAKHADLPWDVVFSSEMFGSFKPDVRVYQGAMKHLVLEPQHCAMIATHAWDLRGAAQAGMKTIYVPRPAEEPMLEEEVKTKAEGGEVDLIVSSFVELAALLASSKK
ncbi:haloacid dehalogenase [Mycena belliarum]|uniref:Haloacid dehalogenase n=1 Tax=Mycena belliarum TaxID=1033014 RepID=A0AAD6TUB6_9AGAR|nr:haloacid dehalogenase [Mycena belliae]